MRERTILAAIILSLGLAALAGGKAAPPVLQEDFSTWPPAGWTFSGTGCLWTSPDPAICSNYTGGDGNCAAANADACGSPMDASLISPAFDLPSGFAAAWLTFRQDFYVASAAPGYTGDVEISTDGGSGWTLLARYQYPASDADPMFRGPLGELVDLSAYLGQPGLLLRFHYVSAGTEWWWQIDDVVVRTCYERPSPTITGATSGCTDPGVLLSTDEFGMYQWQKDGTDIPGATGRTFVATEAGSYSVRAGGTAGCLGISGAHVVTSVAASPDQPLISGDVSGCSSSGVVLTATPGAYSYQWSLDGTPIPGETGQATTAASSGTYTVTITSSGGGCSATSAGFPVTISAPMPTVSGPDSGCGSVCLAADAFAGYQWNLGGSPISGAGLQTYEAAASGDYSVTVTGGDGCTATSPPKTVTVVAAPSAVVSGLSANLCPDDHVDLSVPGGYAGYQWLLDGQPLLGAAGPTLRAYASGTYSAIVTTPQGCSAATPGHAVAVSLCAAAEVSPASAAVPLQVSLQPGKGSGSQYTLTFQRVGGATKYNLYEGDVPDFYSHGGAPGNACAIDVTDLGNGEMSTTFVPSDGNHYYLITAGDGTVQGPSGYDSTGAQIPASDSTCPP